MKVDINTAFVFKAISAVISIGTLLWLLAGKFSDAELRDAELKAYAEVMNAKLSVLMEERMAKMERTELYDRFNEVLKTTPSSEDNYSLDRYMNNDYEEKEASKK